MTVYNPPAPGRMGVSDYPWVTEILAGTILIHHEPERVARAGVPDYTGMSKTKSPPRVGLIYHLTARRGAYL